MAPAEYPVISERIRGFLVIDQIHPLLGEISGRLFDKVICRSPNCADDEIVKALVEKIGHICEAALLGGLVECGRGRVDGW